MLSSLAGDFAQAEEAGEGLPIVLGAASSTGGSREEIGGESIRTKHHQQSAMMGASLLGLDCNHDPSAIKYQPCKIVPLTANSQPLSGDSASYIEQVKSSSF